MKNGVFFFELPFFVLEIFTYLCYANEESDEVMAGSTKTIQRSINSISRAILKQCFSNSAPEMYITKERK